MNELVTFLNNAELTTSQSEDSKLLFVEDAEYEFVGGGNAVNGY